MKKKQIIILVISLIVAVTAIALTIYLLDLSTRPNGIDDVKAYREKLESMEVYTVNRESQERLEFYAKSGEKAYIYAEIFGTTRKEEKIIMDGDTYIIDDDYAEYILLKYNDSDVKKIEMELKELEELEYVEGKEVINEEDLEYQEYGTTTDLILNTDFEGVYETAKTRIYFDKEGNMKYIKTFTDSYEELLTIEMKDDVRQDIFVVPEDYTER